MLKRFLKLFFALALAAGSWLWWDLRDFLKAPLAVTTSATFYTLEPGTTLGRMARELEARGLIRNALYLRALAHWQGQSRRLQAGEYRIAPGTTPPELLRQLVEGRVVQHFLTLVEGWTFRQVLTAVRGHPAIVPTLEGLADEEIMARIGHPDEHPEGRFFPDTYHFPRHTPDVDFLARAYAAMEQTLHREWAKRRDGLPLGSPYEALVLASIVERETGLGEERPQIAGVFVRRLQKGMKLQTDPTVIYGLGDGFDGNIRRSDLRNDTPYNTYVHAGLTPTPICMPGLGAIRAVLDPAPGKSLYFVAKGDGSHQFSATLEEHNRAVQKYQLNPVGRSAQSD